MSKAQYDYIKENLPAFADEVENLAYRFVRNKSNNEYMAKLSGMVWMAKTFGILSDAGEFVWAAIATKEEERINEKSIK